MTVVGLGVLAAQLVPVALRPRPVLAVSHGSRSQTLAAQLARIPSMVTMVQQTLGSLYQVFRNP